MKKRSLIVFVGLLIVAIAAAGAFAAWSVPTHVNVNMLQSAKFDVGIGTTLGPKTAKNIDAVWHADNMAPGDDPVDGTVYMYNGGTIPVNIVWSGFELTGDADLANNICVTKFVDSNGGTESNDLPGLAASYTDPTAHCVTLAKVSQAFGNGYFSANNNMSGTFIPVGQDGYIKMSLALRSGAGNNTINKSVSFTWHLTAEQTPKNSTP